MAIRATDQISIIDVTDAYSVMLTSEAYTFVGNSSGASSGLTCVTQAVAYQGNTQCDVVTVDSTKITLPEGITASVSGSGTSIVTITFQTSKTITGACEATIPVQVDGITVNKKFSFAVAKAGTNGTSQYTHIRYATSSTGAGMVEVPSSSTTYIGIAVTNSTTAPTTSSSYKWSKYMGTDGHSPTVTATKNGDTTIVTVDGTEVARITDGVDGTDGADAITLSITTSNGSVIKNNSGTTVLTAHVYKGGIEQTVTDDGVCRTLGTIKWYNGETPLRGGNGSKTITAGASSGTGIDVVVNNVSAITCQLEGDE